MSATLSAVARMDALRASLRQIDETAANIIAANRLKLASVIEKRNQVLTEISRVAADAMNENMDIELSIPDDTSKKRGRPAKSGKAGRPKGSKNQPKNDAVEPKRGRGRPKKKVEDTPVTTPKRSRGRPKKVVVDVPVEPEAPVEPCKDALVEVVWDVIDRPLSSWRKSIPELLPAVEGLNAEEIQTIIQSEGKANLPSSVKQIADQISKAISVLKNDLKLIGREDGRYYAIADAVPDWKK